MRTENLDLRDVPCVVNRESQARERSYLGYSRMTSRRSCPESDILVKKSVTFYWNRNETFQACLSELVGLRERESKASPIVTLSRLEGLATTVAC